MKYRLLGNTGIQVSTIGYGSWLTAKKHGRDVSASLHRTAYECGINFFDTANVYGNGETEPLVAHALEPFRRDTYVLATKVFFPWGEHPFPGINDRGLSRKHIFEQCSISLSKLKTDYVDLYQCHRFDETTPLVETCRAFADLIARGDILYWGVSQWEADQIRDAVAICDEHDWPRPISNQPQYNMFQREAEKEVFPTSYELGIGQVVYSPLAQGVLSGKYRVGEAPPADSRAADPNQGQWMTQVLTDERLASVDKLAALADGMGITVGQLALAWCLRRKELASCIVGASKPEQVVENAKAGEIELDENVLDRISVILGD